MFGDDREIEIIDLFHRENHPSVERLTAVLSTLPLDLTFVDADDRVAFFSEGPDRIFARSKAIIGRKVQHCHPPRSADTVNKILDDFRSGRQSVAEFWIKFQNKFVHIRYLAVRDDEGKYLGTIELTQDLAPLRQLSGRGGSPLRILKTSAECFGFRAGTPARHAVGWYSAVVGLLELAASVLAGLLWDHVSHAAVFYYGAIFAIAGSVGLLFIPGKRNRFAVDA